jgi:hypothetical protein
MKKCLFTIFILSLLSSFSLFSQPKDVSGWKATTWGMTEEQVLKAMNGEAVKLKHNKDFMKFYSSVGINQVSIDSNFFAAYFQFDKDTNDLRQVKLELTSSKIKRGNLAIFESLKKSLTLEYGTPTAIKDKDKGGFINHGALWIFPSTTVTLEAMLGRADQIFILISKSKGKTAKQFGY